MIARYTGGPAFPIQQQETRDGSIVTYSDDGMTLRDYFAAMAMQALVNNRCYPVEVGVAENAYRVADAMLKARQQSQVSG